MPQGKLKTKVQLPKNVIKKKVAGGAVTKRKNAPITSKKGKQQVQKLKKAITKTVNAAAEQELRALAFETKKASVGGNKTTRSSKKK